MDEMNTVNPADVKVKGILGTLPGEGAGGSFFNDEMWPARKRLRVGGVLLCILAFGLLFFVILTTISGFFDFNDWIDPARGGVAYLYSIVVAFVGSAVLGILLLSSTTSVSTYHRRLTLLLWVSLVFFLLCFPGMLGIREAHGDMFKVPAMFALAFGILMVVVAAERRAFKKITEVRNREGGGPHGL